MAGVSYIRIFPVCKRCIHRGAKDPLLRVIEQLILALLDTLHVMLQINDAEISAARGLNIIPAGVLLQRDEVPNVLMDVAKSSLLRSGH